MRFNTPLSIDAGADIQLVVLSAWFDRHELVVAEVQAWFEDKLIHSDTVSTGKGVARARFTKDLRGIATVDEISLHKALLTLDGNLKPVLLDAPPSGADRGLNGRHSQSTQLIELAADADLFHTPDRDAYATIRVGDHKETWPLKVKSFRRWLMQRFYVETGSAPSAQAVQNALAILEAKAINDGPEERVHTRVAGHQNTIYVDLANGNWESVEITEGGWRVVPDPPVKFRRARGMSPLASPLPGGSMDELRRFVNAVTDDDWTLLCSWLLQALRPRGPYPICVVQGEQGAAKSTALRVLRALIDPNEVPLRPVMRSEHDLMIAATNGFCVALDNLSSIPIWLSDALCRLSTGGGFATRELYTDSEEVLFKAQRPVLINGIEELATRGDLLDRAIIFCLPQIEDDKRQAEEEFWLDFETASPRILGALYDAVAAALRNLRTVSLKRLPRMADFAKWASAGETSFGLRAGQFLNAYNSNRESANDLALESSLIATSIRVFIETVYMYRGSATDLLKELNDVTDQRTRELKTWPKNGRALSNKLRRLAPNLRAAGVDIDLGERSGKKGTRLIRIEWPEGFASAGPAKEESSNQQCFSQEEGLTQIAGTDSIAQAERPSASAVSNHPQPLKKNEISGGIDADDHADAKIQTDSNGSCGQPGEWELY